MHHGAVGHLAFGSFDAGPCCMAAFEAMEAQTLRRQTLDTLFDVGIHEDVAEARLMHAAAHTANVGRLLLLRTRNKPLCIRRRRKWRLRRHRRRSYF